MALAGINNVSVLETPFFGENCSSVSKIWGNQEGPLTRTSIIRKMWRDLESENRTREPERQQTGGMADGNTGSQCSCSSESEDASVNTSEAENECPGDQNQMEILNGQENNGNLCIQRSPAIGTADKERVRQVFREWANKNGSGLAALNVSHKTNCSRAQTPCENECKRVRAVRQWIESNPQQEETGCPVSEEKAPETGCQVEQVRAGLVFDHTRVGVRSPVRGRQAFLDLLAGFETERAKEMQILLESQLVSNCSNRSRLQALFRGRFLRNKSFVQDEKPSTTATTELGLLRQTNTVSDLRKGFLSGSDDDEKTHDGPQSDTSSDNDTKDHEENIQQLLDDLVSGFQPISTRSNAKTRESPGVLHAPAQESHERVLVNVAEQQPPTQIIENRDPCQDEDSSAENNHGEHQFETSQRTLKLQNPRHAQFQPKACRSPREYDIVVGERDERGLENDLGLQQPPTEIIKNKDQERDQNGLVECNHMAPHIEPSEQTLEPGSPALGQYHPETNSGILACQDVPVETGEGHETVREKTDSECGDLTNTVVNEGSNDKSTINEAESVEERHERVSEIKVGHQPLSAEVTVNRDRDQDVSVERSHGVHHVEPIIEEHDSERDDLTNIEVKNTSSAKSTENEDEPVEERLERILENEVGKQPPSAEVTENRDRVRDQDVSVERSHGGYHIEPIIEEHDSEWDDLTNTEVNEGSYANSTENEDEYVQKRHERVLENEVGQQPPLAEVTENRDRVRDQDVLVERSQCAYHIEPIIEEHDSGWDCLTNTKVNEGLYAKSTENEDESVEERHERVLENEVRQKSPSAEGTENRDQDVSVERSHGVHHVEPISDEHDCEWDGLTNTEVNEGSYADSTKTEDESVEERHERVLENEVGQQPPSAEVTENRDQDQDQDSSVERSPGAHHIEPSQRTLELEIPTRGQDQLNWEELEVNESIDHHSETNSETLSWREGSVDTEVWQEPTIEDNGSEWDQLTNTEIFEGSEANSVGNEDELYQDTAVNTEIFEGSDVNSVGNEDELYRDTTGNDFQESLENWHGVATSYLEAPLVVRTDIFYTSGDDNEDRPELRELMSRRRVSSLLQSDFRVRLDQVVQSYVERQDQAFESDDDWMFDHEQHHPDQQSVDENDDATETVEISEVTYPDIHQQSGTEWEIINGLRLDMAKLQERMNSMQSTLETCISMQLELQRSMQQEVSSALNRLSTSGENTLQTCSLCSDNNVHDDSSPNRRGHMYVCSNCAEKVNWSKLKESVRHP